MEPFCVHGTIIAGCYHATTLAKLLVLRSLRKAAANNPVCRLTNVVDDVAIQCVGSPRVVDKQATDCFFEVVAGFKRLRAPINFKKTCFLTNSDELADSISDKLANLEVFRKTTTRNLGTDAVDGRHRALPTLIARGVSADERAARLRILAAAGGKIHDVHRAGPSTMMTWDPA